jgi:hypothetical protein
MPKAVDLPPEIVRQRKRIVGAVAIVFLLLFTVLAILGYLPFIVWVLLDLVVAGVANLLFRRIGRVTL